MRATFVDPVRAQAAIDRFTSNANDLVTEGDSYRARADPRRLWLRATSHVVHVFR